MKTYHFFKKTYVKMSKTSQCVHSVYMQLTISWFQQHYSHRSLETADLKKSGKACWYKHLYL